ncbi:MAG: MFS transporter [Alphaproteobacteria bacterium]|nr:MFS transporter [Alphaproteobacteria bacterium]MBV9904521.1 MFS transporter [Alphaproteobacteria bacterium]
MMSVADSATPRSGLSLWSKLAYGFGAVAFGVKDNGFSYFLLLFYSQVIGVDARLVGLALSISLFVDAFADPIIGYWSDNLRSRFGRRHPFMYASAVPIAALYFLLWDPPSGWSQQALFWYLVALAVLIRVLVSAYEIPSTSMAPELTTHYDERSTLLSYRSYFGWTGGNAMSVFMFGVLFPLFATAAIKNGQFNREAYAVYGIIASVLILISILVSALGTHERIKYFRATPPKRVLTPRTVFKEIFETLANRSFIALFIAAIFGSVAAGVSASLAFYFFTYFWHFTTQQSSVITMGVFGSAIIGALLAPAVSRALGKKRGSIVTGLIAFVGSPLPVVLRLTHVLPETTTPFVFWFVFTATLIDVGLIICFQILSGAMLADLVEQAELKTGRRSEGIFFAASAFIRKVVGGVGLIVATMVLTFAGLKAGADPTQVPPDAVWRLGAFYVPTILSLWLAMLAVMGFYALSRDGHEENLRRLAERQAAAAE